MRVATIIPALNEEECIAAVVREILERVETTVIVVDNGSTDATAGVAVAAGAVVVREPRRGIWLRLRGRCGRGNGRRR